MANSPSEVTVSLIDDASQLYDAFHVLTQSFAVQAQDGFWKALHPGWDTPAGQKLHAEGLISRWRNVTLDENGRPNTMYIKATVTNPANPEKEKVIGFAIWSQMSMVKGRGEPPVVWPVQDMAPGDEQEQRFLKQATDSFFRRRVELLEKKRNERNPAIFAFNMCGVLPEFQGRGAGVALTQWGVDEAKRRGIEELALEASVYGRRVYQKLGFQQEGGEIEWRLDGEFRGRECPSAVFMKLRLV